jgi:hypothetical protein
VVTVLSNPYGAVASISNAVAVSASDSGGAGIVPGSWAIAAGPTCTTAPDNGTASISGTTTGATVTFDAPADEADCTIDVTVGDGVTTSAVKTLNIHVAAGDSLQQDVTQVVNPGVLDLLACGGDTSPDPTTCGATMSPITLNGSDQDTTGHIEQVTVKDARGGPIAWSLTAQLGGDLTNGTAGLTGPNAVIDDALLRITPTCVTAPGSSNADPADGAGGSLEVSRVVCSAAAGDNTGSFLVDADLDLTVPSTTYAGTYTGTINFIVS